MLQTTYKLINEEYIEELLTEMVKETYEQVQDDPVLLCMECCDVDLFVAASYHEKFQDALKENFELDAFGEVIDQQKYNITMRELDYHFVEMHKKCDLFDYFPAGIYKVKGEERESETDMLAPKGYFFAPFEDAVMEK